MDTDIQANIITLVTLFFSFFGVPNLVQWLKAKFGIAGGKALAVTAAVAVALAFVELGLKGQITPEGFVESFAKVFTAATLYYKLLLADKS